MSAPTILPARRSTSIASPEIRLAAPGDRDALRRFLRGLSPASASRRFHGDGFRPTEALLDLLLCRGVAGRALVVERGHEIIGHAVWTRLPRRRDAAELGVVVADAWHGRGLGTRIAAAAVRDAAEHGVEQLVLPVLRGDRVARRLAHRLLPAASGTHDDHVVELWARIG